VPGEFIYTFPATATGSAAPSAVLSGSNTAISGPYFLFLDSANHLWSSQSTSTNVSSYSTLSGNQTPASNITGFGDPTGLYVDGSGKIYVADATQNAIDIFAAGSNGNATPLTRIVGSNTGLNAPQGLWLDATGRIYVANSGSNSIAIFAANPANGTLNIAPAATIGGSSTGLAAPYGITLDSLGNLWVANLSGNNILEFVAGASGNAAPSSVTTMAGGGFAGPYGIAVDAAGYLYVGNNYVGQVDVFAPGAIGNNAIPVQVLSGGGGGASPFACPMGVAVH